MKKQIKESVDYVRVNLNVPKELDLLYKNLARKRGITKTSMIIYAMSWFLDYSKTIDLMPKMLETLNNTKNLE